MVETKKIFKGEFQAKRIKKRRKEIPRKKLMEQEVEIKK